MTFADITMVPVPRDRQEAYRAFSARMAAVYRDHGATRIVEYWQAGERARPEDFHAEGAVYAEGELRGLADAAGARDAESVVVSVIEWPSREARDRGIAAAAQDRRVLDTLEEEPLFDGARLLGETFEVVLRAPADD